MTDTASTRAEVCAVACAELFRDAGEIMVSPMTNMASVGARLARLTFSPDILLTDGFPCQMVLPSTCCALDPALWLVEVEAA